VSRRVEPSTACCMHGAGRRCEVVLRLEPSTARVLPSFPCMEQEMRGGALARTQNFDRDCSGPLKPSDCRCNDGIPLVAGVLPRGSARCRRFV
jgi:hypothetical protein